MPVDVKLKLLRCRRYQRLGLLMMLLEQIPLHRVGRSGVY